MAPDELEKSLEKLFAVVDQLKRETDSLKKENEGIRRAAEEKQSLLDQLVTDHEKELNTVGVELSEARRQNLELEKMRENSRLKIEGIVAQLDRQGLERP